MLLDNKIEQYIIDAIDGESYGKELKTTEEKLQFVLDTFVSEKWSWEKNQGKYLYNSFEDWLRGLPTAFNIDFYNFKILKLGKKWNYIPKNATEEQEDQFLENYWSMITIQTFKLFKKYGIK
jgi:hypothetical protein